MSSANSGAGNSGQNINQSKHVRFDSGSAHMGTPAPSGKIQDSVSASPATGLGHLAATAPSSPLNQKYNTSKLLKHPSLQQLTLTVEERRKQNSGR